MANKNLFRSIIGKLLPWTDTVNEELAPAYALAPAHALAQYAATGCLNDTFYATAGEQLAKVSELASKVEPEFVAKTAVFCRQRGHMKDMPALLAASLSVRSPRLLDAIFDRVVDDARMLRTFVQIVRSGTAGRKSFGSLLKRLVRRWLATRSDETLFRASVGQSPSLADILKMVHPRPETPRREALYGYLLGRRHDPTLLPDLVRRFEEYKATRQGSAPEVPFQMLTSLDLGPSDWAEIARNAGWQMLRMNLNTFARHGALDLNGVPETIATRLRDPAAIARARVLPYQLLAAYRAASTVPAVIGEALQDALELSLVNVPAVNGKVYLLPDVSGSMQSPVTGRRAGATTAVRCVDVAALVAAAFMRKNSAAEVLPFEQDVVRVTLNPRDSVVTNAARLTAIGGGGTNCSAPLSLLNRRQAQGDLVIFISDNESWVDAHGGRGTATLREWQVFRARNPQARLVCIDLAPNAHTQAVERPDILNVGGFSDQVFEVVAAFARGELGADHWVSCIEAVDLLVPREASQLN